jgi:hypothetical protein
VGGKVTRLNGEFGDLFHNDCACAPGKTGGEGEVRAPEAEGDAPEGACSPFFERGVPGRKRGVVIGYSSPV